MIAWALKASGGGKCGPPGRGPRSSRLDLGLSPGPGHHCLRAGLGSRVLPKVELATPAKLAYQAAAAVMSPPYPAELGEGRRLLELAEGEEEERDRQQEEDGVDGRRRPERGHPHVER